jgi:transcriptional regulator with XRE-family HTH domain
MLRMAAPPNMKALGDAVRERRLRLGLTQRQAAEACGVSDRTFIRIEKGTSPLARDLTLSRLDEGLEWEPGSAQRVLDGGEPTPIPSLGTSRRAATEPFEWVMQQNWTREKKLRVLDAILDIEGGDEGRQRQRRAE